MDKDLLKSRYMKRLDSLSKQSSEDKTFFMSAPDIHLYFDPTESKSDNDEPKVGLKLSLQYIHNKLS